MKKLLFKILLFILIPLPLLYGLEYITDEGLKKSYDEDFTEWTEIGQGKINADVVVMGSSRAWVHISPRILDSIASINSYNIGMDSWTFLMQRARMKFYLKHNPPPTWIVLNVDMFSCSEQVNMYAFHQFLPYLSDPDIFNALLAYQAPFDKWYYSIPLYKYNNNINMIAKGAKAYALGSKNQSKKYKGYLGVDMEWDGKFDAFKAANPKGYRQRVDAYSVKAFNDFADYCTKQGIRLVYVYSPEYIEGQKLCMNRDSIMTIFKQAALKHNVPFLDYSSNPLSYQKSMFYNSMHLNKTGSELFSKVLALELKQLGMGK